MSTYDDAPKIAIPDCIPRRVSNPNIKTGTKGALETSADEPMEGG